MATTLAQLATGYGSFKYVACIDGIGPYLLSNASQSAVRTAWGGDFASATIFDLIVDLDNHQKLEPFEPFSGGGTLKLIVPDDAFGVIVHRTNAGKESLLAQTCDRDDQTIYVQSGDEFVSLYDPTAGAEVHIGTECIQFTMVSGRGLQTGRGSLGLGNTNYPKRGKYTAYSGYNQDGFAEHHRVTTADNGVRLQPVVSQFPRTWQGRRVSLWLHTETAGVLNSKADALCVFAGQVAEISDSAETGHTHVLVEHILDTIKESTLGKDMYEAQLAGGHYVKPGWRWKFRDNNGASSRTANDLVVVASGATGSAQLNAGFYSVDEFASIFNAWLAAETVAGRLYGNYTWNIPEDVQGSPRTVLHWYIPGSVGATGWWNITWPVATWGKVLGFGNAASWSISDTVNAGHADKSDNSPQPSTLFTNTNGDVFVTALENSTGTFQDNFDTLPSVVKTLLPADAATKQWGMFLYDTGEGSVVLIGTPGADVNGQRLLSDVRVFDSPLTPSGIGNWVKVRDATVPMGGAKPRVRQIFAHEGTLGDFLKWVMYSTGTRGYNHPTHDILSHGQGLGIPYGLLGASFDATVDLLPLSDFRICVTVDKPTSIRELIRTDLVLRCASLVWRQGTLVWRHWSTPSSDIATVTLGEDTKSEPAGNIAVHRSASVLDSSRIKNVIKVNYDRDITKIGEGGQVSFKSPPLVLEDATSVDDHGGRASIGTLDAINVYSEYDSTGQGIRSLMAGFLAWLPFFSRPLWRVTRSIGVPHFESIGVGDQVIVEDEFIRDPSTGQRGVSRPGIIVRHRYSPGGAGDKSPTNVTQMVGEVDIVFLTSDRAFAYAPCAEVDQAATNGGLVSFVPATSSTFQFMPHQHSNGNETVDVGRFSAGDRVLLAEIDPADPAAPEVYFIEVSSVDAANNQAVLNDDLSGTWSPTKRYRMFSQRYQDATTSQRGKTYQAGDDGQVAPSVYPNLYGINPGFNESITTPLYVPNAIPELYAEIAYKPGLVSGLTSGAARTTGYDKSKAALVDSLIDFKTARNAPFLSPTAYGNSTYQDGFLLVMCRPIFLGDMLMGGGLTRKLFVRPVWRGSLLGTRLFYNIRVTLTGTKPTNSSTSSTANQDVTISAPSASNTWSVLYGDSAWHDSPAFGFNLKPFNHYQFGFLLIECQYGVETKGLSMVQQGPREAEFSIHTPINTINL